MAKIAVEADYAASAALVWKKLADFGGLASWMPGVESCETEGDGIGALRKVAMGAVQVVERLEAFDDAGRSLSYSIAEGPMPLQNYLATIRVRGDRRRRVPRRLDRELRSARWALRRAARARLAAAPTAGR